MAYPSWLRSYYTARNCTIVLVAIFVLLAIVRLALGDHGMVVEGGGSAHFVPSPSRSDLTGVAGAALLLGLIVSTMLGAPLARENGEHLEIAWTTPASRTRYAFSAILANLCAVWFVQIVTIVLTTLTIALFTVPQFVFGSATVAALLLALFGPIAWYAMYLAATSSMKRGFGAVLGVAWLVALLLPGVSLIGRNPDDVLPLRALHAVLSFANVFNPLRYASIGGNHHDMAIPLSAQFSIGMLIALAVLYTVLGLVQWNRLEA